MKNYDLEVVYLGGLGCGFWIFLFVRVFWGCICIFLFDGFFVMLFCTVFFIVYFFSWVNMYVVSGKSYFDINSGIVVCKVVMDIFCLIYYFFY